MAGARRPEIGDLQNAYLVEPGGRFVLGTDTQGLLGLVAGYYQGWVDGLVMRLADVTLAFPTLLLLIAVAAAVRPSLPVVFVVIGAMVADGRDLLGVAPWVSFAPGIAIGMAVLGFNLVGDGLREAFDPRLRSER